MTYTVLPPSPNSPFLAFNFLSSHHGGVWETIWQPRPKGQAKSPGYEVSLLVVAVIFVYKEPPHVRESKTVLDSEFHAVDPRF